MTSTRIASRTKEIPLTQGYTALVDEEDYERVSQYNWHAHVRPHTIYAARSLGHGKGKQLLHKFLLPDTPEIDHRDGNGLNCCRDNLRPATHQQNCYNTNKQQLGYKGVWDRDGRYMARIQADGRRKHLGTFDTAEEAAIAYDKAAKELHGEFASLNFEDDDGHSNLGTSIHA